MGQFKKVNAFLVYSICFNETVKDTWCLDKSVGQIENDLERAFVKMAELRLTDWPMFFVQGVSMREQSAKVAATQAMPQASTRFFYVFYLQVTTNTAAFHGLPRLRVTNKTEGYPRLRK